MIRLEELLRQCTAKLFPFNSSVGWGTGFFVAPNLILTCAHVVEQSAQHDIKVWWQDKELFAKVEEVAPAPYDVALLRVNYTNSLKHPYVCLDDEVQTRDPLYLFGYPDEGDKKGEPRTFNCDGITGSDSILFNLGQVRPGMSGSPLLNQRTKKVCGVVIFTRGRALDLGGGAISVRAIYKKFPQLQKFQDTIHSNGSLWIESISRSYCGTDFGSYCISVEKTYERWWEFYTLTDVEIDVRDGQSSSPIFDFLMTVKTDVLQGTEGAYQDKNRNKDVEKLSVLEGLRKYAIGNNPEHILLVGRPGSGKSTALARLALEEATCKKKGNYSGLIFNEIKQVAHRSAVMFS